jgi:CMP-N-acetylneuraminic acid synthetase
MTTKNKPEILAIIPVRGGSKGIPRKNIKPIAGKPLLTWTIEEAQKSRYISRLIVSTEDREIAEVARGTGVEVIGRPMELAEDATPMPPVFLHAIDTLWQKEKYSPDIVLTLQVTCPLRKVKHIDEAIEKFLSQNLDCLISVYFSHKHRYEILGNGELEPVVKNRANRQERKPVVLENGVIYLSKIDLIRQGMIVGGKIGYYQMDYQSSVNIDEPVDFFIAEQLLIKEKEYEK